MPYTQQGYLNSGSLSQLPALKLGTNLGYLRPDLQLCPDTCLSFHSLQLQVAQSEGERLRINSDYMTIRRGILTLNPNNRCPSLYNPINAMAQFKPCVIQACHGLNAIEFEAHENIQYTVLSI